MAFTIGLTIAIQAPINASLAKSIENSFIMAATVSFVVGSICLILVASINGDLNLNSIKNLSNQSWWKFLGGILGAFFVFGTTLVAPKIGLINMFIIVLIGQLIMGLILDNIGAFGLEIKHISWQKILGLSIIIIGLIIFFYKEIFGTK